MAILASFLILCVLLYGRSLRFKNLSKHIRIMIIAMVADLLLVVALVVFRNALGKVDMGMHWTLKVHVPIAISTLGLYILTAQAGYSLYKGDENARARLKVLDKFVIVFRVLTLVTSAMVIWLRPEQF